ncbi:MAG: glycoside hydrolase [Verrucomicrobiota bacterium]|nr:glycoside hydrolase [Verrucomicrobiota bacterium]
MMNEIELQHTPGSRDIGRLLNWSLRAAGALFTGATIFLAGCAAPTASIPPVVGPGAADPPLEDTVYLRNDSFRVAINTNSLQMTAMFLNTGRTWMAPAPAEANRPDMTPGAVRAARQPDERTLELDVDWHIPLTLSYQLAEAGSSIELRAVPGGNPEAVDTPAPQLLFPMVPLELGPVSPILQEAIIPLGSGLLLPLGATELEPYFQAGLPKTQRITEHGWNLPFFGIAGDPHGSACMIEYLTPAEGGVTWLERSVQLPGGTESANVYLPTPLHAAAKARFHQPIAVRLHFFETGGFMAMANRYRQDLIAAGQWKSWDTKASDAVGIQGFDPLVAIWDEAQESASAWNPEDYDLLTIDFAWFRSKPWQPSQTQVPSMLSWPRWDGLFSPATACRTFTGDEEIENPLELLRVDSDGVPMTDPAVYSPIAARDTLLAMISEITRNPQVRGLAIPSLTRDLTEDWNPLHPSTRGEDLQARRAILEMVSDEAGFPIASDGGPWWGEPYQNLAIGGLTVGPVWTEFCRRHDLSDPTGGNEISAAEVRNYWNLAWNPAVRIPLWQSVFHDATVAVADPYEDPARFPIQWARHDLFLLLYAAPACWWAPAELNSEDPTGPSPRHWEDMIETSGEWVPGLEAVTYGERKQRQLQILAPWLARSLHLKLEKHEYLSSDRMVQKTTYSNGYAVVVNFSDDQGANIGSLGQIPPRGYYLLENSIPFAKGEVDPLNQ